MPITDWKSLAKGMVRQALPANIGLYLGTMAGDRSPITERDLKPDDLQALRAAVIDASNVNGRHANTLGYFNYGKVGYPDFKGWGDTLKQSFNNPGYRMQTTLGQTSVKRDQQGNARIVDTYDFNSNGPGARLVRNPKHLWYRRGHPTAVLDAVGYLLAPETEKTRRPININLGMVKPK
jgi:hypothetical protein